MGEQTAVREESNKVEGGGMNGIQRIALSRDPKQMNQASDLGIGVKVAGGVKCEKCGNLHTVITDVQGNLTPQLYKGLVVVQWCGRGLDGASYEEVRSVLVKTEDENIVEILVKECSGPPPDSEVETDTRAPVATADTVALQDVAATTDSLSSLRNSPSNSTGREGAHTHKSLSPSSSPVHLHTCAPASSTSTPSPTPPPSPTLRRGAPQETNSDPRPASINIPAFRPQGDIVRPKFMINDIPTNLQSIVGPIRKYTIESFLGGAPNASIHISLRYRGEDGHLRILLHQVKHKKKNKSSSQVHRRTHFINTYLLPDVDKQGVRSCEVLSQVSDLENPQFYIIPQSQLVSVALRVILWEAKGKNPNFVGEVLLSLADSDVVKLQGLPGWFPMCDTDPNLPPLPSPVLAKKTKKEDIFQRVRRGTGYALQSLRRPASMEGGRLLSTSSIENLTKKLQGANVTMPRRVKKDRRPLSGLFFNTPLHVATTLQDSTPTAMEENGTSGGKDFVDFADVDKDEDDVQRASLSVPSSPLLARRMFSAGRDSTRKKKISSILNVLKDSLLPIQSIDLPHIHSAAERGHGNGESSRRLSLSMDVKRRQIPASPLSTSSSPFSSPIRTRARQVTTQGTSPTDVSTRLAHEREIKASRGRLDGTGRKGSNSAMDSLTGKRATFSLLSEYSAEEEVSLSEHSKMKKDAGIQRPNAFPGGVKIRSRSADDILDVDIEADLSPDEQREYQIPETRTRAHDLSRDSSGSSMEYNTTDSRPLSLCSSSDDPGESSLDNGMRTRQTKAITSTHKLVPIATGGQEETDGNPTEHTIQDAAAPLSRWRSFDDLLGAIPFKKLKPRWLHRIRTHHVLPSNRQHSPQLQRRSSEPTFGPPMGRVKLELTFNPDTSMVGVRLHEHTLSTTKTDLTVQTYLFSRGGVANREGQRNIVSFKKTHYSHTLVASFHCDSKLQDLSLQVSLETSGRFFNRRRGHVMLDLGPLLLPSPSLTCNQWFPLFHTPLYSPSTQQN